MTEAERDCRAYELATEHLLRLLPGVTPELLARYRLAPAQPPGLAGVGGIYYRVFVSAQNRGMGPTVIEKAIGGLPNLSEVTFGFDPLRVLRRYQSGDELLNEIIARLHPIGKVRREPQSLWPQFCRSGVSGAKFLASFDSGMQFHA